MSDLHVGHVLHDLCKINSYYKWEAFFFMSNSAQNNMLSPGNHHCVYCACQEEKRRQKHGERKHFCLCVLSYVCANVCVGYRFLWMCVASQPAAATQITEERAALTENRDVINPTGYPPSLPTPTPPTYTHTAVWSCLSFPPPLYLEFLNYRLEKCSGMFTKVEIKQKC